MAKKRQHMRKDMLAAGNTKKMHYAAGLGDGNMQTSQQGLRGNGDGQMGRKRIRREDDREDFWPYHSRNNMRSDAARLTSIDNTERRNDSRLRVGTFSNQGDTRIPADDIELMDYLRAGADRRATLTQREDPIVHTEREVNGGMSSDGPWQLSVIMLLGMVGVLVGLFIHFSTDPSGQTPPYLRTRMKKKIYHRPSYRKKTDEWSDDEEMTDDNHYRGDSESARECTGVTKKRMHIPPSPIPKAPNDPTARLYYGENFRQQEHRFRKSTTQQHAAVGSTLGSGANGGNGHRPGSVVPVFPSPSRPVKPAAGIASNNSNRGVFRSGITKFERSPAGGHSRPSTPGLHNGNSVPSLSNRNMGSFQVVQSPSQLPKPPFCRNNSGLGTGLEGFEQSLLLSKAEIDKTSSTEMDSVELNTSNGNGSLTLQGDPDGAKHSLTDNCPNELAVAGHPVVKPMGTFTPSSSFASMSFPSEDQHTDSGNESRKDSLCHNPPEISRLVDQIFVPSVPLTHKTGHEVKHESPEISGVSDLPISGPVSQNDNDQQHMLSSPHPSPRWAHKGMSLDSAGLSELPTPRVDHTKGKKELSQLLKETGKHIGGARLPSRMSPDTVDEQNPYDQDTDMKTSDFLQVCPELPFVPNLNSSPNEMSEVSSNSFHIDAPRSVLLEELQLVRMESGVSGPRWRTKYELEDTVAGGALDKDSVYPDHLAPTTGGQSHHHPMFGSENNAWYEAPDTEILQKQQQESENREKLRQASTPMDPENDPRNSIQHIRTDLTNSSDASSSLSSKISFSEVKLLDIIGGGGFGQVWRAKWKGTPVAVKVLTGSAQAETVPKSVLEEFIAEINMVSGMRHPNICLFMGACLDPPNRAIITELCENGSLWDALRSPLATPYHVADGVTRTAWPLYLYDSMTAPPPSTRKIHPPLAPGGAWPWILVKRIASGSARGMTYLHSGNPPVLHRDLKSANILLDESYTAKLADFGLSRLKAVRSGMTGNCGTVQWMAPEVLCNEDYAEPADVFSFGIILWEMLTKECPYEGMTPIQCALSVLNENKRPEIPGWCPQSFRALIKNCLERDPRARPTFPQILAALDSLPS